MWWRQCAPSSKRTPMPSQELIDPLRGVLARLMAEITPGDIKYSFFCASGTEAIEGAIKLAKMYTQKPGFIVAVKAFHGKTMGSLSMMGKADYRQPAGHALRRSGLPRAIRRCRMPSNDSWRSARRLASTSRPCSWSPSRAKPARSSRRMISGRASREPPGITASLLIADEVQTGLGRTGKLWGLDHWDVAPDILAVAKSLGGGVMPVSAFCSTEEIWQCMMYPNPFIHTTTTGGGALACSAAIAAIHVTLRDRLWEQAAAKGEYLIPKLQGAGRPISPDLSKDHRQGLADRHAFPRPRRSATRWPPACSSAACWWPAR